MKVNEDKYHTVFYLGLIKKKYLNIHLREAQIEESDEEKLSGINLDKKVSFKKHAQTLCKKASQKLHALQSFQSTRILIS